jgi:hypothetical protein
MARFGAGNSGEITGSKKTYLNNIKMKMRTAREVNVFSRIIIPSAAFLKNLFSRK